jgi:hypothetical protein
VGLRNMAAPLVLRGEATKLPTCADEKRNRRLQENSKRLLRLTAKRRLKPTYVCPYLRLQITHYVGFANSFWRAPEGFDLGPILRLLVQPLSYRFSHADCLQISQSAFRNSVVRAVAHYPNSNQNMINAY